MQFSFHLAIKKYGKKGNIFCQIGNENFRHIINLYYKNSCMKMRQNCLCRTVPYMTLTDIKFMKLGVYLGFKRIGNSQPSVQNRLSINTFIFLTLISAIVKHILLHLQVRTRNCSSALNNFKKY